MKHFLSFLLTVIMIFPFATSCTKNIEQGNIEAVNANTFNAADSSVISITTIAGQKGLQGDADGKGSKARFWNPTKMVYDNRNKTLYVADGTVIRSVDSLNNVKTYLPFGKINNWDEILDIDVTNETIGGSLYFITEENGLYKIQPSGTSYKLTTIVDRIYEGNDTGKLNTKDHFDLAHGMATGKNGDIYFFNQSWYTMHHIQFFSTAPFKGVVKTFVGKPSTTRGGDVWPYKDGTGEKATFGYGVWDMCADGKGNMYVADFRNDLMRKVTPSGVVTSLFHYAGGLGIDIDGPVSQAESNRVDHVSATKDGSSIYFTSYGTGGYGSSPRLRVVRSGIDVKTLVTGIFGEIGGIATTADGKTVYVSEVGNKIIRKVVLR